VRPSKTGIIPIMHAMGIRRSLLETHPGLVPRTRRSHDFSAGTFAN
jgi:hypothetical protein